MIELKCKTPGMLTFIFNGERLEEESYYSFTNEGITQNRFNLSHDLIINNPEYIGINSFEIFNIHGCAQFNMSLLGGKIYECEDFYLNTTFNTLEESKRLLLEKVHHHYHPEQ